MRRRRELATLRAIGFGGAAIVAATLVESMVLAVPGALLGAALAWFFFHGMAVQSLRLQLSARRHPGAGPPSASHGRWRWAWSAAYFPRCARARASGDGTRAT